MMYRAAMRCYLVLAAVAAPLLVGPGPQVRGDAAASRPSVPPPASTLPRAAEAFIRAAVTEVAALEAPGGRPAPGTPRSVLIRLAPGGNAAAVRAAYAHDGRRSRLVVAAEAADGSPRPRWFVTEGLFVAPDPADPDRVVWHRGVWPKIEFWAGAGGGAGGKAGVTLAFMAAAGGRESVRWDPGSVVDYFVTRPLAPDGYDLARRSARVNTAGHGSMAVLFDRPDAEQFLARIVVERDGRSAEVRPVLGDAAVGRGWLGTTEADVRQLGLPQRELTKDEFRRFPFMPAGETDPGGSTPAAAARFAALFPGLTEGPATRPAR